MGDLDTFLAAIPSLPRSILSQLTHCLIERMDEIDGDEDLEPDEEDVEHDGREIEPLGNVVWLDSFSRRPRPRERRT